MYNKIIANLISNILPLLLTIPTITPQIKIKTYLNKTKA